MHHSIDLINTRTDTYTRIHTLSVYACVCIRVRIYVDVVDVTMVHVQ